MAAIRIERIGTTDNRSAPVFAEAEKLLKSIQKRAFELFAERGFQAGHAVDDWLRAEREFCWPAAELIEYEKDFVCELALPGYEPSQVEVSAAPREIIVHARPPTPSKTAGPEAAKAVTKWSGFGSNDVYRCIELGADIDVEQVNATIKNGILKIVGPKRETPSRQVAVAAA
jgi:HSP20 family molecular chaperone IbpA